MNGHPRDQAKVSVHDRWPLVGGTDGRPGGAKRGIHLSVFARIERGQGADLGKRHFCARPIILRALLRVILHFEGTMGK